MGYKEHSCGQGGCGCGSGGCNCRSAPRDVCPCGCNKETGGDMMSMMMGIADLAWKDLTKEKMMKEFDKQIGEKMNAVIKASVEASIAKHQHKMVGHMQHMEHKGKIEKAFTA